MKYGLIALVAVCLLAAPVMAQEAALEPVPTGVVSDLQNGFPAQIIDAKTIGTGQFQFGINGGYVADSDVLDEFVTTYAEIKYGITDAAQLEIGWPFVVGEGRVEGNFDTTIAVLMGLVEETDEMPQVGLKLGARTPTGHGFTGYDGTATGVIGKQFGEVGLFLNAAYTTIGNNSDSFRNDADSFTAGATFAVLDDVVVILDAFSDESFVEGQDRIEMVELGARFGLTEVDVVSVGVGAGIGGGDATPDIAAVLGYQRLF